MKKIFLFLILISAVSANAQTLKEALYGGKLKMDTGKVIRKSDDWTAKIDTSTKKSEPETKIAVVTKDASMTATTTMAVAQSDSSAVAGTPVKADNAEAKSNTKIWKDYIDELTGTLRTEVLTSKKIKNGTYSLLIEYEIGVDGQITVNNVSCSPESSFLEQQVKERITLGAPQMTPLLGTNGKPRKAVKKQQITLSK